MHMLKYCTKSTITNQYDYSMCTTQFTAQLNFPLKTQYSNHYVCYTYLNEHPQLNNLQFFFSPKFKNVHHTVTFLNFGISKQVNT